MNYKLIYENLIEKAKLRQAHGYTEKHHVIPKCLGGTNDFSNIVKLYPEEHYLAHQLLIKLHPNHTGIVFAAIMMATHDTNNRINNKLYGWLKRKASENKKEHFRQNPRIGSHMSGKKHKESSKQLIGKNTSVTLRKLFNKPLYCFDLQGNLLKEFTNLIDAAEFAKTSPSNIKYCAEGKFRHIKGYIWSYCKTYKFIPKTLKIKNRKIQTPDGMFNSLTAVVRYYNLSSTKIIRDRCLSNKDKWKEWKYLDGPEAFGNEKRNKI